MPFIGISIVATHYERCVGALLCDERADHEHIVPKLLALFASAGHHQFMEHLLQNTGQVKRSGG